MWQRILSADAKACSVRLCRPTRAHAGGRARYCHGGNRAQRSQSAALAFCRTTDPQKTQLREAAEREEREFYSACN